MRVLIVDDSHTSRAMAIAVVHQVSAAMDARGDAEGGLHVATAESGVAALQVLAEQPIDLLLVDMHLPDLTGLDVLRFWSARKKTEGAMALVVSSLVSDVDRARAEAAGASGFLTKPLSERALLSALVDDVETAR